MGGGKGGEGQTPVAQGGRALPLGRCVKQRDPLPTMHCRQVRGR